MTATTSPKHVFMSYSRRDEAVMRRIVKFLRKQGINVWVDNEKLVPGTPIWEEEIEKAIKSASSVIVILSPDSKNSEWVRREISLADQYRTRIFPVLVRGDEESSITLRLITRQYVDIRQNEESGLGSLSAELSRYLKELEAQERRSREAAERLAREKVEREAAENAAREKAKRDTAEKVAREEAERKATEKTVLEEAERKAAQKTSLEKAKREAYVMAVREKAEREAADLIARPKKTVLKRKALWKYALIGFILLCLIITIGRVWGISSSIQKQKNSPSETVDNTENHTPGSTSTSSVPTPLVLAGTPLPFTPQEITSQNADRVVQFTYRTSIALFLGQVVYSPDSKMLALIAGSNGIFLYESSNLNQISHIDTSGLFNIAFSPDGSILALGTDDGANLFLIKDGTLLLTLVGHTATTSVTFSPNGETLASGSDDKTIRLWRVSDGELLKNLEGHTRGVNSVVFSPDGEILASGSNDRTIRLWRVSDGAPILILEGNTNNFNSVAFSPDGETLASGSSDNNIRLWRVSDGALLQTLEVNPYGVKSVTFSPDGSILASGLADGTICLWRVSDGELLKTLEGHTSPVWSVAFSPDGTTLASSDSIFGAIRLWGIAP